MYADDYRRVFVSNIPVIISGDLNAKHTDWNSTKINEFGEILYRYVEQRNAIALRPVEHTFFRESQTQRSSDVLDIAMLKNIGHSSDI